MGSGHSKSANITSNGSEGLTGFVDQKEGTEVMICDDQTPRSTRETTNESCQPNKPTPSEHGQKFDVFLSHSGKQKNFVRQLYRDITNLGVSCFFDEDPQSLPLGEDFPPRIFEAAKTCRVAVLLLSEEFLESKWPMLEASTFMKARHTNPNLQILPLYYMIPPEALKQITADNKKWKEIEKSEERRVEWQEALKAIRPIKGLKFSESENEVEFRDKIVKEVSCKLLKQSRRYHVPCMQGEERMCQEVADFFNTVHPNERGIRIAGLYGIAGHGKTTLGKATCNFKLADFEGKVCHLEFSQGGSFERLKLALKHLIHCSQSHLQSLTSEDEAQVELSKRVRGQRVWLVLDNITEESIGEVTFYVQADFKENSCILLSALSVDVLLKHFQIDRQSCMRVPSLLEEEAIGILLERTSVEESTLGTKDRSFVLKCAKRCSFKENSYAIARRGRTFHPLALKAFGGHLFGKYGSSFHKWVDEIDGLVDRSGYGLDDVFSVLGKAFDDMHPKYRTVFMLLTVYMLPNMSSHSVTEWLAINCNEEISFIEKAVEDLCKKAFIEESVPGIRIHGLYIEFAQRRAKEMGRWLWWKGDQRSTRGLSSQDTAGFELVKLEHCKYRSPSQIASKYLQNTLALQLVDVKNLRKIDLAPMNGLRSIVLHNCQDLEAIKGMGKLLELAWLQINQVHPMFKLPELSSLQGLQHLEIDIAVKQVLNQLGDLTSCFSLREIKVRCPSLLEFPKLNGLPHLEKVEFNMCDKVKEPLDCRDCVELQSVVLDHCCQMVAPPLLAGCKKASKIVLSECNAVTACPEIDVPSALKTLELYISSKAASAPKSLELCRGLENFQLWGTVELKQLPSFRSLSNLTVLNIGRCGIMEPPDLTSCVMLENVFFFTLKNLERFPNFSSLKKLKNLSLYNCRRVRDPPDISGCHELQVFHLLYNDNLKGLPRMDGCPLLEQIKVSWNCEDEIVYDGIDPDTWEVDDNDEFFVEHFKDETCHFRELPEPLRGWPWLKDKTMLGKKHFRGVKVYNSITAPYESSKRSKFYGQNSITLSLRDNKVIAFPTPGRVIEDSDWLNKVQEYFFGKEDFASASATSERDEHQVLNVEDLRNSGSFGDVPSGILTLILRCSPLSRSTIFRALRIPLVNYEILRLQELIPLEPSQFLNTESLPMISNEEMLLIEKAVEDLYRGNEAYGGDPVERNAGNASTNLHSRVSEFRFDHGYHVGSFIAASDLPPQAWKACLAANLGVNPYFVTEDEEEGILFIAFKGPLDDSAVFKAGGHFGEFEIKPEYDGLFGLVEDGALVHEGLFKSFLHMWEESGVETQNVRAQLALHEVGEDSMRLSMNSNKQIVELSKAQKAMAEIEWYKRRCPDDGIGYYDAFKQQKDRKDFRANINRGKLATFWVEFIQIVENELPPDFQCRSKWIHSATAYRQLVEPLDIAYHYRHDRHEVAGHYLTAGRPRRYKILQKWFEDKMQSEKQEIKPRTRPASLTQDSCFWAYFEEVNHSLEKHTTESMAKLKEFENGVNSMIDARELSSEIFLENSSFMLWWKNKLPEEYKSTSPLFPLLEGGWELY